MTVLTRRASAGHYLFRHVTRMEWIKLRSLRSTWWTLAITAAGAVASPPGGPTQVTVQLPLRA
jgi:hypothetical protein